MGSNRAASIGFGRPRYIVIGRKQVPKRVRKLQSALVFCFCQNNAYEAGEWLKFRIHYGLITAGQATLEVKSELLNDQEVFHIIGFGETTGMASWFFKVEDHYQSYVLKDKDLRTPS